MEEKFVKNQKELNEIPLTYKGKIFIESDTEIVISRKSDFDIIVLGNTIATIKNHSKIIARDNSKIDTYNSEIIAQDNSYISAYNTSIIKANDNSVIIAHDNSVIEANANSQVLAYDNTTITAYDNSQIEAFDYVFIKAYGNGNVITNDYVQISEDSVENIKMLGNSRRTYLPNSMEEFLDYYNIKHTKTKAIFCIIVEKDEKGRYIDNDNSKIIYTIGKTTIAECNENPEWWDEFDYGIHLGSLKWCLNNLYTIKNKAILEVEVQIKDIVIPKYTNGKVRTSKVKVRREIPINEFGVYKRILQ